MTMRSVAYVGSVALLAQVFLTQGCGGDNPPATTEGTGGVTSAGGTTEVAASGGTTTPETTGNGGTTEPATTGAGGEGGTTGGGTSFEPLCAQLVTAANESPTKNGICLETDPQFCYKTCGPQSIGFKSETCTAGVYVEQSGCSFEAERDYSCYKIPDVIDPACPTDAAPQATQECDVSTCTLCNLDGQYFDSKGNVKEGYCVCQEKSEETGLSKWSCASTTAWPCPARQGC